MKEIEPQTVADILGSMKEPLSAFDGDFCKRMYADDFPKYGRRLDALGFANSGDVLDAGCGFGQWAVSLAQMGNRVSACDISPGRVEFVNRVAQEAGLDVECRQGVLEKLPFDDNSFDAVFCYGVVFLTPWKTSVAELARVLRPGGKLYINANGLGWFLFLWKTEHNKFGEYDPKQVAADTFVNTIRYEREGEMRPGVDQLIIEPEEMQAELETLGFGNFTIGGEGTLHPNNAAPEPKPFFRGEYEGQTGVYELIAVLGD